MIRKLGTICFNTLREMIRDRTISILFFGAVVLVILSSLLGNLSLDEQRRILIHLGLASIHLTSLGIVLFQGSFVLQKEIDKQTCLMVLVRPISRFQFLLGTWLGIACLLALHVFIQGLLLFFLIGGDVEFLRLLFIELGILIEMFLVLSFVFFAVQWVRPVLGLFSGLTVFLVGNWLDELQFLFKKGQDPFFKNIALGLNQVWPNLFRLNFRSESFALAQLPYPDSLSLFVHFSIWIVLFLCLASWSFDRRDLV